MGFLKRFLPFIAAFAVGVFVASFFVTIGFPRFEGRNHRHQRHHRMKQENEQLRRENLELRRQLSNLHEQVPPVATEVPLESVPYSCDRKGRR